MGPYQPYAARETLRVPYRYRGTSLIRNCRYRGTSLIRNSHPP